MKANEGRQAKRALLIGAGAAALVATAAIAAETITYRYDARGRLVKVERTGTVNNNINTAYEYDKADNREKATSTGAPQ